MKIVIPNLPYIVVLRLKIVYVEMHLNVLVVYIIVCSNV